MLRATCLLALCTLVAACSGAEPGVAGGNAPSTSSTGGSPAADGYQGTGGAANAGEAWTYADGAAPSDTSVGGRSGSNPRETGPGTSGGGPAEAGLASAGIGTIPSDGVEIFSKLTIGWSLGNALDAPDGETSWGNPRVTPELLATVSQKFNLLRLPVTWANHLGDAPDYVIEPAFIARVREVAQYAMAYDMYVIVNMMHEEWIQAKTDGLDTTVTKYVALWKQIANYFNDFDEHLLFEAMNEPTSAADPDGIKYNGGSADGWAAIDRLNAEFVKAVRGTGGNNARRWLLLTPYGASGTAGADNLTIPDSKYLMVSVHQYAPWDFCSLSGQNILNWDGSQNYVLDSLVNNVRKLVDRGIPVIWTEFAATVKPVGGGDNESDVASWASHFVSYAKDCKQKTIWFDNNGCGAGQNQLGLLDRASLQWRRTKIVNALTKAAGVPVQVVPGLNIEWNGLGVGAPDLVKACGGPVGLDSAASHPAYGWQCANGDGFELGKVCQDQYMVPYAHCTSLNDANCWYCDSK